MMPRLVIALTVPWRATLRGIAESGQPGADYQEIRLIFHEGSPESILIKFSYCWSLADNCGKNNYGGNEKRNEESD